MQTLFITSVSIFIVSELLQNDLTEAPGALEAVHGANVVVTYEDEFVEVEVRMLQAILDQADGHVAIFRAAREQVELL